MDIKTVIGFILIAFGTLLEVTATIYGIDSGVTECVKTLIATGLLLIAGKELLNRKKEGA